MKKTIKKIYRRFSPGYHRATTVIDSIREVEQKNAENFRETQEELARISARADETTRQISALDRKVSSLMQTANMISAQQLRAPNRPKILFLVHEAEVWPSLAGIYAELQHDPRFEILVASINRIYPNTQEPAGEDKTSAILDDAKVPHIRLRDADSFADLDIIKHWAPDAIFRQSQWDADIPPAFRTEQLRFARLYQIPYELFSLLPRTFEIPTAYRFWQSLGALFVINDEAAALYQSHGSLLTTRALGSPKADEIVAAKPAWPDLGTKNKRRVFWSGHHSIFDNWDNFGAIREYHANMLRLAENHPEIDWIFSFHPALNGSLKRLERELPAEVARINKNLAKFESLANTEILREGGYLGPMKAADLVVTDGISMLIEPQFTDVPILWLERPGHNSFNPMGARMIRGVNAFSEYRNYKNLEAKIMYFLEGGADPQQKYRRENYKILTSHLGAAKRIAASIREDFGMKEGN